MGAIPVADAGVNVVAGIDRHHQPEATWPVGKLATTAFLPYSEASGS